MRKAKRYLAVIITGLLASVSGQSASISPDAAMRNATEFLNTKNLKGTKALSTKGRTTLRLAQTVNEDINSNPAFYVFSRGENAGFVIAAADDRLVPVLGYTDKGTFTSVEELPEPIKYLLNTYKSSLASLTEESTRQSAPVKQKAPIYPLLESWWGQDAPFNNDCPIVNGERTPVGCVGLANAMVMNYHRYPEHGVGSTTYTSAGATQTYNFEEHIFNYDIMLPYYSNMIEDDETVESQKAVADFCFAAAVALGSRFTVTGTASSLSSTTFSSTFQYPTEGLGLLSRDYFTIEEWEDMVYEELSNERPVVYGGKNGDLGHAFVIDGYEDGLFNINWGWFGDSDGYFSLTSLRPGQGGTGSNSDNNYSVRQEIVRGVRRPDSPAASPMFIADNFDYDPTAGIFTLSEMTTKSGYRNIILGIEAYDETTGEKIYLGDASGNDTYIAKLDNYSFSIDFATLPEGQYRLRPVIKLAATEKESLNFTDWYPVYCTLKKNRYCDVTVESGRIKDSENGSDVDYSIKFDNLQMLTPIVIGENTGFTMDAVNNGNTFLSSINKLVYRHGTDELVSSDSGREIVGLEPGASAKGIAMALNTTVRTPGEYDIQIVDPDDNSICYSERIPITVLSTSNAVYVDGVRYIVTSEEAKTAMAIRGGTMREEMVIPSSVTIKGSDYKVDMVGVMFANTSSTLKKISLPETLTTVAPSAFYGCVNLAEVKLPEGLKYLGGNAFGGCKALTTIDLPSGITEILTNTFNASGLTAIRLHEGITSIGKSAFAYCKLTTLSLPSTITSIGEYAYNNMNLKEIICKTPTPPTLTSTSFSKSCYGTAKLIVPVESLDAYKKAEFWQNFTNKGGLTSEKYIKVDGLWYEITSNYDAILVSPPDGSAYNLQRAVVPSSASLDGVDYKVIEVAESAFSNVSSLTGVSLGEYVKKIGAHAFENTNVTSAPFVNSLEEIGDYAFHNTNIGNISRLPANIKRIGESAFEGNQRMTFYKSMNSTDNWLVFPATLETVGNRAFAGCTALDKLQLNTPVDFEGDEVFEGCKSLKSFYLADKVVRTDVAGALVDMLDGTDFYVNKEDREYFEDFVKDKANLYDILSVKDIRWAGCPDVKGLTDVIVEFDSRQGNPRPLSYIIKNPMFRDIATMCDKSYDDYSETGTITLTLAPYVADKGTASIIFEQPGLSHMFDLNVVETAKLIESIVLSDTERNVKPGETFSLYAVTWPELVDDSQLVWSTSDASVATVDNEGLVTAHAEGTAKITTKALMGPATTNCVVTVRNDNSQSGAFLPETDFNDAPVDIYTIDGVMLRKNIEMNRVTTELSPGVYILRGSSQVAKIVIR